jgi:hypothetical protein
VGLTGALVLFIGVFTPIVSVPTVGYINYIENEKIDGVVILGLAIVSFLLLLARRYRGLWFTGLASLGVLLFTFISLQIKIAELRNKLGVELTGNRSPSIAEMVARSVQIQWGWPVLIIGAAFILWAAASKFVLVARGSAYRRTHTWNPKPVPSDPAEDPSIFTYMCRSVIRSTDRT